MSEQEEAKLVYKDETRPATKKYHHLQQRYSTVPPDEDEVEERDFDWTKKVTKKK